MFANSGQNAQRKYFYKNDAFKMNSLLISLKTLVPLTIISHLHLILILVRPRFRAASSMDLRRVGLDSNPRNDARIKDCIFFIAGKCTRGYVNCFISFSFY